MKRFRMTGALAIVTVLAASPTARAQQSSDLEGLLQQTVVSTASKSAESSSAAPATVSVITADEIRRHGIRTLDEAINYLSMGMVTQSPLMPSEIGARGVTVTGDTGNHVLVLLNGHILNEQWGGSGYFDRGVGVSLEIVDHIEIVLGPGSVLYGSSAMLGVINIITKRAKDHEGVHAQGDVDVLPAVGPAAVAGQAYHAGVGYGRQFELFGKTAELLVHADYYTQSGPGYVFGPQNYGLDSVTGEPKRYSPEGPGTGIWGGVADNAYWRKVPSAYVQLSVGDFEVNVRGSMYFRATPYYNWLTHWLGDFNAPDDHERNRFLSVDVKHRATLSSSLDLRTRVYADSADYQAKFHSSAAEDCSRGLSNGCDYKYIGFSRWIGTEVQAHWDWLKDNRYVTMLGADGRVRYVGSETNNTDPVTGFNPGTIDSAARHEGLGAIFLQQTAKPLDWLSLNVGARYDIDQRFGQRFSPRGVVAVQPWEDAVLKAIYSEAFRAPTMYEATLTGPSGYLRNDKIAPETVHNVEGVLEQRVGTQRFLVGAFANQWRGLIAMQEATPEEVAAGIARGELYPDVTSARILRNVDRIDNYGANLGWSGSLGMGRLQYGATATIAYAKRNLTAGGNEPLQASPSLFGNARVSYDLGGGLPTLGLAGQLVGPRLANQALSGGFTPTPKGPTTVQLRLAVTGAVPGVSGLSYRGFVDYAFSDRTAYVAGPLQYAPTDAPLAAELAPLEKLRASLGLQYEFMP